MTDALNFSRQAIADLTRFADSPGFSQHDREGILFLVDLLDRAEVFVLPDKGELLDRSKPRPEIPGQLYKPAFPVVALEYRAVETGFENHPIYEANNASKRIALAWEWDGVMPGGGIDPKGPKPGQGVVIASIPYYDSVGQWVPVAAAFLLPFDGEYRPPDPESVAAAFVASGRITAKQAAAPQLEVGGVLPIMPTVLDALRRNHGWEETQRLISADLMDELNAYADLCHALACNNVHAERRGVDPRVNRSRRRMGRPELKDFHVLQIGGGGDSSGFDAAQGGVRSHLRRGHIRRLGPDRITWVNATMVRGSRVGFVDKVYAPKGLPG